MATVSQLQHNTGLSIYQDVANRPRMNRIICTIGPKTQTVAALKGLIESGMSVARMNFSHGSYEFHQATIDNVRIAARELGVQIAIALDTKGPEIRTGLFEGGGAQLNAGDSVLVTCDPAFEKCGNNTKFYLDYANLCKVVKPGGKIFIDDGVLDLTITEIIDDRTLRVLVNNKHLLTDRKGTNLPKADVDLPAVSTKDRADLEFGARNEVDMVFASFIRNAEQVREVRAALGAVRGPKTQIISKIENHQGVDAIDSIIAESDGIMVARGDLGVEIPAEQVVVAQKMLIAKCNVVGKSVICATQMLESMTNNPRPTRAEVSDVANAVLDGADCVMLSGETAKGLYPNEVVRYMARICLQAQVATRDQVVFWSIKALQKLPLIPEESICSSAVNSAFELNAAVIVVLSNTGRSAKLVAKYRPECPIVCASQDAAVCRALSIVRGVFPVYYDTATLGDDIDREKRVGLALAYARNSLGARPGQVAVAVHADQFTKGFANQTRVIVVPPA